jgi:hypothetical protein
MSAEERAHTIVDATAEERGQAVAAMSTEEHGPAVAAVSAESAPTDIAPYERLAELAEAELAACEADRPEDLADLYAQAEAIRASLPGRPPAKAEPALRRAAAAQERIGQLLGTRLAERGGDLERVHRARDAARAYATTAKAQAGA